MSKKRVVIYVRVSTEEQAKHGYSLSAQIEALEAYAKSQGWEVIHVYVEDGYSAKDLNRPQYQLMMEQIKAGNVDVLLVYRLDRLTRSVVDLYDILQELEKYNCSFKSSTEVYDTVSAMGKLFITLVAAIAQWERENLAERVKMGIKKKATQGKFVGGMSAYGYDFVDDQLVINEPKAEVIRNIFDMAKTMTYFKIAKQLTLTSLPPRRGGEWNKGSVQKILMNPVYAGYIQHNEERSTYNTPANQKTLYQGSHVPIIEPEQFWEMQALLQKRSYTGAREETSEYLFTKLLRCAQCGSAYVGHKARKKKGYRCSGQHKGKTCNNKTFMEERIVEALFKVMDNYGILDVDSSVVSKQQDSDSDKIQKQLQQLQKLHAKKRTMYEKDVITLDQLVEETKDLKVQIKILEEQLQSIVKPDEVQRVNHIKENFKTIWEYVDEHDKKEMLRTLINRIVVDVETINGKENKVVIKHIS